jgi:phosphopantetheinyl transferase
MSHATFAVGVAVHELPVGIDVELVRAFRGASEGFVAAMCTLAEIRDLPNDPAKRAQALARAWTGMEALIKVGRGSLDTMREWLLGIAEEADTPRWRAELAG